MLKSGLLFLFGTFSQLIFVVVSYEFYYKFCSIFGGIGGGSSINIIKPIIWWIIVIELIVAVCLIANGLINEKNNR